MKMQFSYLCKSWDDSVMLKNAVLYCLQKLIWRKNGKSCGYEKKDILHVEPGLLHVCIAVRLPQTMQYAACTLCSSLIATNCKKRTLD